MAQLFVHRRQFFCRLAFLKTQSFFEDKNWFLGILAAVRREYFIGKMVARDGGFELRRVVGFGNASPHQHAVF